MSESAWEEQQIERFLATLRRLPDKVVLDLATREFEMTDAKTCLCGWAVQDALALAAGRVKRAQTAYRNGGWHFETTHVLRRETTHVLARLYGGEPRDWADIFFGVTCQGTLRLIEAAFFDRVEEALT